MTRKPTYGTSCEVESPQSHKSRNYTIAFIIYTGAFDTRSIAAVALGPYIAGYNIEALVEGPDLCCKACWI